MLPTTTGKTAAASPDGIPGAAARRPGSPGRVRPASSPARSAARRARAQGKLPSTARTSAARAAILAREQDLEGKYANTSADPAHPAWEQGNPKAGECRCTVCGIAYRTLATLSKYCSPDCYAQGDGRASLDDHLRRLRHHVRGDAQGKRYLVPGVPPKAQPAPPSAKHGAESRCKSGPASTAATCTQPGSRTTPGTAPSDAATLPGWRFGSLTRCPEPDGTADVYDLTVEGEHEFFMRHGILVHNCGEIGLWVKWQTAWDESIKFAVRKGSSKIICDGTPKVSRPARALIRRFLRGEELGVIVRRLRTVDNAANLSEAFYQAVIGAAKGTRLERQELEGELLDDVENALWTRDMLERIQVPMVGAEGGIGHLHGAVIGVDPSDGNEDSDEQAYCVAGKGAPDDHHLYVARSWGGQMAPAAFARKVILEAVAWNARIVVERNHGGAWLKATFHQVMKELDAAGKIPEGRRPRVETIHASQAKRTRAEPVSAMYERDLVRHCYEVDRYQVADRGNRGPCLARGPQGHGGAGRPDGHLHRGGRGEVAGPARQPGLGAHPVPQRLVRPSR